MSEERECQLKYYSQCCCTCKWQYIDRSHPGTDGKPMTNTRGFICAEPFIGYTSGWFKHGLCECHLERPKRPTEMVGNDSSHYACQEWDARYQTRDHLPTWWKLTKK